MRVLLITGSYPPMPCGVGDYTMQLAQALAARPDVDVGVLTSQGASTSDERIRLFACMNRWRVGDLRQVDDVISKFAPDIVHLQLPTLGYGRDSGQLLVPLIAWRRGSCAIRTMHEGFGRAAALRLLPQVMAPGGYIVVRPDFITHLPRLVRPLARTRRCSLIRGAAAIPQSDEGPDESSMLRAERIGEAERLIAFFGFLYPAKGAELLFEIADPVRDRLLIIGRALDADYLRHLESLADTDRWRHKVTFTGFVPPSETASLLKAADAVVLPFRAGGGSWNSSIGASVRQGTPVVTTSNHRIGLDQERLVSFSRPDDVDAMRIALDALAGRRRPWSLTIDVDEWSEIADEHIGFYRRCCAP